MNKRRYVCILFLVTVMTCMSCASSYQDRLDALNQPEPAEAPAPVPDDGLISRDDMVLSGACIVNADCASTQYCELGRCISECAVDKPCANGQFCSKRGKCVTQKDYVDVDPDIKLDPTVDWSLSDRVIRLDTHKNSATFKVSVASGGSLKYRVQLLPESAKTAVSISDAEGLVASGGSKEIHVTIDRSAFPEGDHNVSVNVIADAGQKNLFIEFSNGFSGRYAGFIEYTNPGLGRIPLIMDLIVNSNGTISGHTVSAGSVLFPDNREITGKYNSDNGKIYLSLLDLVEQGAERNVFGRNVGREIGFEGDIHEQGVIQGEVEEVISGLLPSDVSITGTYYLARVSLDTANVVTKPVAGLPVFTVTSNANVVCEGVEDACSASNFPYNMIYCSQTMRTAAFKIGDTFTGTTSAGKTFVNFGIVDECEANANVTQQKAGSCVNLKQLECMRQNQQEYLKSAIASNEEYQEYFKDLGGIQRLYAFIGNDKLVDAYRVPIHEITNPLSEEVARLEEAQGYYTRAERSFFEANNIKLLATASKAAIVADGFNVFRTPLQYIGASHSALEREVSLKTRKSFESQSIKAQLRKEVQEVARVNFLEGVVLAKLVTQHGGAFAYELAQITDGIQGISAKATSLEADLNPLGYPQDYVPFVFDPSDSQRPTNFQQLVRMADMTTESAVQKAQIAENNAQQLEVKTEDIQKSILDIKQSYGGQLLQLCGVSELQLLSECGSQGGEFAVMLNEIEQQYLDIEKKYQAISDLYQMLAIKEDLAQQIAGIKGRSLRFMQSNGAVLESLDIAKGEIQAAMMRKSSMFGSIGGFFGGMAEIAGGVAAGFLGVGPPGSGSSSSSSGNEQIFNPGAAGVMGGIAGGVSGLASAGLGAAAAGTSAAMVQKLARVDAQKARLQNMQAMRLQEEGIEIAAVEAAAEVKMLLIQMAELNLDLEMAHMRLESQVLRATNMLAQVDFLMHQREVMLTQAQESVQNPLSNLSYRIRRDHAVLQATNEFDKALADVYLAARGLEHELNVHLPQIESQLFQTNDAQQLRDFLTCLSGWYDDYAIAFGTPHDEVIQLSLREDVLGFTEPRIDEVTGETITPQELFRRVVFNPKNITKTGKIEFLFITSIAGGSKNFSSLTCNDRIKSVRVMLQGDALGDNEATVLLRQEGDSYLRDCSSNPSAGTDLLTTYHLDNRSALIQTGINSFGIGSPNYELTGRSVASDRWILVIPRGDEAPNNADLDPLKIDDVIIEITHASRTLRSNAPTNVFSQCNI